jgi:hypothetical protein
MKGKRLPPFTGRGLPFLKGRRTMSLVQAIDRVTCYVHEHPCQMTRAEVNEFCELAQCGYVLVVRAGLLQSLPQISELRLELESQHPPLPPVQFISKLNLPGEWQTVWQDAADADDVRVMVPRQYQDVDELPPPAERVFRVCASHRWLQDMATLRLLAETDSPQKSKNRPQPTKPADASKRSRSRPRVMKSAASETRPNDEPGEPVDLSKLAAHPVRIVAVDQEVVDALRQLMVRPTVPLTEDDRYILTILDAYRNKALTYEQIEKESIRMNGEDHTSMRRLNDSIIRQRIPILETVGFVARPPGTQKKGVSITEAGRNALHFPHGNPTETQRKN